MNNVYFIGAHPDDLMGPAALAFTLARRQDFAVRVVDLTRGEAWLGWRGMFHGEAAAVRTAEEEKACALLGVEPAFLGEIDGEAYANRGVCERLAAIFQAEPPRAVVTHWPINSHVDHVMCYAIVCGAMRLTGMSPEAYFYEESQSSSMPVRHYLPFGQELMDRKVALCRCYPSQVDGDDALAVRKTLEARYHGYRCGAPYAEPYGSALPEMAGKTTIFAELGQDF